MLPQLFRGKEHGCLDTMRIGEALLIAPGPVTQLVAMPQYHVGFLLLLLHPVEILSVPPGPVLEQQGVQQER